LNPLTQSVYSLQNIPAVFFEEEATKGGERAWFLEEESEPRKKVIFLAETRRKIIGLTFQLT